MGDGPSQRKTKGKLCLKCGRFLGKMLVGGRERGCAWEAKHDLFTKSWNLEHGTETLTLRGWKHGGCTLLNNHGQGLLTGKTFLKRPGQNGVGVKGPLGVRLRKSLHPTYSLLTSGLTTRGNQMWVGGDKRSEGQTRGGGRGLVAN